MKKMRKPISALLTLAMVSGLVLPAAAPALAYSKNSVSKVISIANDDVFHPIGTVTIREDKDYTNDFEAGDIFTATLPSGVAWDDTKSGGVMTNISVTVNGDVYHPGEANGIVRKVSDQKLEIKMPANILSNPANSADAASADIINIDASIKAKSSVEGDIKLQIDGKNSGVTKQELLIARAHDGDTVTTVDEVETISETGTGGVITIEEAANGSMGNARQKVEVKLPANFDWVDGADFAVTFSGGFQNGDITSIGSSDVGGDNAYANGRTLVIWFTPDRIPGSNQLGTIRVVPTLKADNNAKYGDVEVTVSGTNVDEADVVIAKYVDFGVELTVKEVKELIAGRFDVETEEVTIEELVGGTLIQGRKMHIEFPTWVKVSRVNITDDGAFNIANADVDIDDNEVDITVGGTSNGDGSKIKAKFTLSIAADKSGDIEMAVSGKSGGEGKLVIAKAISPVSVEGTKTNVKIGVKNQALADFVITENKDEAILAEDDFGNWNSVGARFTTTGGELRVVLSDGVAWSDNPTVEVIEGNLELKADDIDTDGSILTIPIKNSSSKASKIKISDVRVDLDRTIPEGAIEAKIRGNAVVQNYKDHFGYIYDHNNNGFGITPNGSDTRVDDGEFDTQNAAKFVIAEVVTPAPEAGTVLFNVGSTVYTAGGVTKVMDAAPYIKNDRTYVPVRYLALALGVSENDIAFENGVVTLTKGTDVIKLTMGSTSLLKNDATVTMDVAPESVNGRTMLPARFVAEAFGAVVGYANGQVVISY